MAELVGERIGNFDIVAYLGEGAHVHAYLAKEGERAVVIKVLKSSLVNTPEFQARFDTESERALALDHPNIVKMYGHDRQGDILYIVEEFLPGGSLLDIMRAKSGPLPMDKIMRTLEDIAAGLDYAHARGVIHSDLKPENVLYNAEGAAQLSDLGITKDRDQKAARSRDGLMFGNPGYMSPEEWQGKGPDARADIYALGILLFEMLTGQLPFEIIKKEAAGGAEPGGNFAMLHLQHLVGEPIAVRSLRPDLDPAVESVIRRAMAKNRDSRYPTAGAMVAAFKDALGGKADAMPIVDTAELPKSGTAFGALASRLAPSAAEPATPPRSSANLRLVPPAERTTPQPQKSQVVQTPQPLTAPQAANNADHAPIGRIVLILVGVVIGFVLAELIDWLD